MGVTYISSDKVESLVIPDNMTMGGYVEWCDSLDPGEIDTIEIMTTLNFNQAVRAFWFRNWAEIVQDNAASYGVLDGEHTHWTPMLAMITMMDQVWILMIRLSD